MSPGRPPEFALRVGLRPRIAQGELYNLQAKNRHGQTFHSSSALARSFSYEHLKFKRFNPAYNPHTRSKRTQVDIYYGLGFLCVASSASEPKTKRNQEKQDKS